MPVSAIDGGHWHTKIMTKLEQTQSDRDKAWDALMTMEDATIPIRARWKNAQDALDHELSLEEARAELKKEQNGNA